MLDEAQKLKLTKAELIKMINEDKGS
jgi:hypothetical protein